MRPPPNRPRRARTERDGHRSLGWESLSGATQDSNACRVKLCGNECGVVDLNGEENVKISRDSMRDCLLHIYIYKIKN